MKTGRPSWGLCQLMKVASSEMSCAITLHHSRWRGILSRPAPLQPVGGRACPADMGKTPFHGD